MNGDGSGETIALIEAYNDPTITSDLNTFDQTFGLPPANLTVVNQAGNAVSATAQTNSGWTEEESLDVETAHPIAPGANILVVEANSQSIQDLLAAVNTARNTPGVVAVSMSWGFPRRPMRPRTIPTSRHRPAIRESRSSPPAETAVLSPADATQRPRPTCCRSAGPRCC